MESSQFINQTRLSKKQLQLHVQQQQNQNKYYLNSPHDINYHQLQPQQRCQYISSNPPIPHYQGSSSLEYPTISNATILQSPTHRRILNVKKFNHHPTDPNSIEVCIDYENQHNNVGVVGKASSVSVCTES